MKFELIIDDASKEIGLSTNIRRHQSKVEYFGYENSTLEETLVKVVNPWILSKMEDPSKKEDILKMHSEGTRVSEIAKTLQLDATYVHRVIAGIR